MDSETLLGWTAVGMTLLFAVAVIGWKATHLMLLAERESTRIANRSADQMLDAAFEARAERDEARIEASKLRTALKRGRRLCPVTNRVVRDEEECCELC